VQSEYCFHFFHAAFYETKVVPHFYLLLLTYILLQQILFHTKFNCSQKSSFSFSLFNKRDSEINTWLCCLQTGFTLQPHECWCMCWNRRCANLGSAWPLVKRNLPPLSASCSRGRQGLAAARVATAPWNTTQHQGRSAGHRPTEVTEAYGFSGTHDSTAHWKTYLQAADYWL